MANNEITDKERTAAERQRELSRFNVDSLKKQASRSLDNYDMADAQNARLRDVQLAQNARKSEADRFEAQRALQAAALSLFGSMNQAMNGSAVGNTMKMLADRNDSDNSIYWQQLMDNQNAVRNAYDESLNQNQLSRNAVAANLSKSIADIESDYAANLNNINQELGITPGTGEGDFGSDEAYDSSKVAANNAVLSGYIMPEAAEQAVRPQRNKMRRNDYYSQLMNRFNNRR